MAKVKGTADKSIVLVSWVAVNNDPYERDRRTGEYSPVDGHLVPGPTLTLLFDKDSPYLERVGAVVLLHRASAGPDGRRETRAIKDTLVELNKRSPAVLSQVIPWKGEDPTDHHKIFEFLREAVPKIRRRYAGKHLVIHISPGTPSMQTLWVLMAETGLIEAPFELVKSYRASERRGRPPVVSVKVGLETFYKVYKGSLPQAGPSENESVMWDPARFRTSQMKSLFAEARRFAQVCVPVLILGERGTGKSTLAGWIRANSPFRRAEMDSGWPAVACGQYSAETMRAELFGYARGAFTGAVKEKEGLLHAANGDTLFLDEVGDVSRDLQRLLIKALEEKRYHRIGDNTYRESDFRLISATNLGERDLNARLDPDFRDRISLLTLHLPPLRDVNEELDWLWESAFQSALHRAGLGARRFSLSESSRRRVVASLKMHALPGNMRDLFRVAYRMVAAIGDSYDPLSEDDAVDYGLEALTLLDAPSMQEGLPQVVARAFADHKPLDPVVRAFGQVSTKAVEQELREFVATELRRIARIQRVHVETLCDVSERSLRGWVGPIREKE